MLAESYNWIILDLSAGIDRTVRELAGLADLTLVLTSEEPTALTDAYALIKVLHRSNPASDRRIIVNMASSLSDGRRTYTTLAKACERFLDFHPPLAGVVRFDRRVRDAIRAQSPLLSRSPTSDAAQDVERIATDLLAKRHSS